MQAPVIKSCNYIIELKNFYVVLLLILWFLIYLMNVHEPAIPNHIYWFIPTMSIGLLWLIVIYLVKFPDGVFLPSLLIPFQMLYRKSNTTSTFFKRFIRNNSWNCIEEMFSRRGPKSLTITEYFLRVGNQPEYK